MSMFQFTLNRPIVHMPYRSVNKETSRKPIEDGHKRGKQNAGPSILTIFAYFLGLASVAVVVISGQFPWFTLAPGIVMLMVAHFRRLEAKYQISEQSRM